MMEPTEEDSVPLRHGVGGGKAPSSSTFQWLPRKMPRVPDVGFKMAVFALFFSVFVGQIIMFAGQFLTLRELKEMNAKLTPPTPEILFAPPPPPPHVVPGGAIEYKVVSWTTTFPEGADATGKRPDSNIKPDVFCMCSGEPCPDISLCEEEVYIGNSSMLSFVEVFRGDGLTNEDIFASCEAPVTNAETHITEAIYLWNFTKVVPYAMGTPGYYIPESKNCSQGFENRAPQGSSAETARDYTSLSSKCLCHEANAWPDSDYLKKVPFYNCRQFNPKGAGLGDPEPPPMDACCWDRIGTGESPKKITYGSSWQSTAHVTRSCLLEKLMNKLGQDGWSLKESHDVYSYSSQAQPSLYFVRQAL